MHHKKRVTVVIPARYASTRLPGKPLLEIHGKPMVFWVASRVARTEVREYLVATDDKRIMEACRFYNIPCELTSTNCENGTERVAEISLKNKSDYFINVQGDEPLISVAAINAMHTYLQQEKPEGFVQAVSRLNTDEVEDKSVVKVAISNGSRIIYLSRSPTPFYASRSPEPEYFRCMGLYGYSGNFCRQFTEKPRLNLEIAEKIEQLRCLEHGLPINSLLVEDKGISVDTREDLTRARSFSKAEFLLREHSEL